MSHEPVPWAAPPGTAKRCLAEILTAAAARLDTAEPFLASTHRGPEIRAIAAELNALAQDLVDVADYQLLSAA